MESPCNGSLETWIVVDRLKYLTGSILMGLDLGSPPGQDCNCFSDSSLSTLTMWVYFNADFLS